MLHAFEVVHSSAALRPHSAHESACKHIFLSKPTLLPCNPRHSRARALSAPSARSSSAATRAPPSSASVAAARCAAARCATTARQPRPAAASARAALTWSAQRLPRATPNQAPRCWQSRARRRCSLLRLDARRGAPPPAVSCGAAAVLQTVQELAGPTHSPPLRSPPYGREPFPARAREGGGEGEGVTCG